MARLGCLTAGCDFRLWPKLAGAADTLIWPHIPVRAEAIEVHGVPFRALLCQDQQRYDLAPRRRHELELK